VIFDLKLMFIVKIYVILLQNFLFISKDEQAQLKAIDFGLSDFVKPVIHLNLKISSLYGEFFAESIKQIFSK